MIIFRYVGAEFLKFFFAIVCFFIGIYFVIDFLEKNTRYFPKYGAGATVIFEYYLLQTPKMLVDMLPFAVMLASIVTCWLLAKHGEVSALRAAGVALFRVVSPVFLLAALLSCFSFFLAEWVVPRTAARLRYVETVKIERSRLANIFLESTWVKGQDSILHFKHFDPVKNQLFLPEYFLFRTKDELQKIAYGSVAKFNERLGVWVLEGVHVASFPSQGKPGYTDQETPVLETNVTAKPPRLLAEGTTADQISFWDLQRLIADAKASGSHLGERDVELYQKLSMPFASLILSVLGFPFALRKERQAENYKGIIVCLALAILYWVGNLIMRSVGQNQMIHPLLAAWTVNLVFGCIAFVYLRNLDQSR